MAAGARYYYFYDGLGSVAALSNANNAIIEAYCYDAFGRTKINTAAGPDGNWLTPDGTPAAASGYGNRFMFTGREYDSETDLYSYRARMYSPALGRFLQTDPIGNADSMNLYQYCGNNPVNWIDPEGFERISIGIYPVNSDPSDRFLKDIANSYTTWAIGATDPSDAAQQMKRYEKMIDKINKGMGNISIGEVFLVDHGCNGDQRINGRNTLDPFSQAWKDMCNSTGEDCSFILTGCNVAGRKKGREYLQNLADEGNRTVYAWDKPTCGNYNEGTLYKATPMGGAPEVVHPGIEEGDPSEVGIMFRMINRAVGSKRIYRNY